MTPIEPSQPRRPRRVSEAERLACEKERQDILDALDVLMPPANVAVNATSAGPPHAAVAPLACDPSAGIPLMPPPACHARFFAHGALYPVRLNHYPQVATCSMTLNQPR